MSGRDVPLRAGSRYTGTPGSGSLARVPGDSGARDMADRDSPLDASRWQRTARDVRRIAPKNDEFWTTFARGTHQNWPVFSDGKAQGLTGRFVFRLSAEGTRHDEARGRRLRSRGSVADTAGNRSDRRLDFTIDNGSH